MTEKEWLKCAGTMKMLRFLWGKTSQRKIRLLAVGCCRQIWKNLTLKAVRQAVDTAEKYADDGASGQELTEVHRRAVVAVTGTMYRNVVKMAGDPNWQIKISQMSFAVNAAHPEPFPIKLLNLLGRDEALKARSPVLVRCVCGNPFRKIKLKRPWLTPTVSSLAQAIYDDRAFDRLAILADALEEVGCDNADILAHCRKPGEHVAGCWVVDALLSKE